MMKTMLGATVLPLCLLFHTTTTMAQTTQTGMLNRSVTVAGTKYLYQVYVPVNYDEQQSWPVILSLHGSGERGNDGVKQTAIGLGHALRMNAARFPAIIVFPQVPPDSSWTGAPADAAIAALDVVMETYRTDAKRVYLTGLSMGGHGTWYLAYRHAQRFAAIAPVCGWIETPPHLPLRGHVVPAEDGVPFEALAAKLRTVPTWIFHGELDTTVPAEQSRRAYAALKAAGADVRYTEYLGTGHNSWDPTYASVEFVTWLFAQKRP